MIDGVLMAAISHHRDRLDRLGMIRVITVRGNPSMPVTSLKKVTREEGPHVERIVVRPAHSAKRQEATGEPGVENVLVLLQSDLALWDLEFRGSSSKCSLSSVTDDPVIVVVPVWVV